MGCSRVEVPEASAWTHRPLHCSKHFYDKRKRAKPDERSDIQELASDFARMSLSLIRDLRSSIPRASIVNLLVMPALVAGIQVFLLKKIAKDVDGRVKPGQDELKARRSNRPLR